MAPLGDTNYLPVKAFKLASPPPSDIKSDYLSLQKPLCLQQWGFLASRELDHTVHLLHYIMWKLGLFCPVLHAAEMSLNVPGRFL